MADDNENQDQDQDQPPQQPQQETTTPTPQEVIADLERQLADATGNTQVAFDTTKAALRTANPNLPDSVFEAGDLAALTANVEAHKATAAHILANPPKADVNTGGGTNRVNTMPDGIYGIRRVQYALAHPGAGMTE